MKVLNFGSLNIDHVYSVSHIIREGETLSAYSKNIYCGGKGLNQSIAMAKAGISVFHAGVVGEDGDILEKKLKENNIDSSLLKHTEGASSHTIIQVDEKGQNSIIVFSGENMKITDEYIDFVLKNFSSGDIIVLQNELDNTAEIMRKAKSKGMKIVFNPSPVNLKMKKYPLELVDIFILNEIEGFELTQEKNTDEILEKMKEKYPNSNIVLTLGKNGAVSLFDGKKYFQEAFKVEAVDTTAAGDTFTGYFISGLINGKNIEEVLKISAKASSITVSRKGASDSIPHISEIKV